MDIILIRAAANHVVLLSIILILSSITLLSIVLLLIVVLSVVVLSILLSKHFGSGFNPNRHLHPIKTHPSSSPSFLFNTEPTSLTSAHKLELRRLVRVYTSLRFDHLSPPPHQILKGREG
jgi:hypothetical protein